MHRTAFGKLKLKPSAAGGVTRVLLDQGEAQVRKAAEAMATQFYESGEHSFGIITGRLIKPQGVGQWSAFVIEETLSPLKRLHHFLHRQDVAPDTPMAIISDGGEDVVYPTFLRWRPVQRILDWFHIAMRFEHILQRLRGLRKSEPRSTAALLKRVARTSGRR